MPKTDTTSVPEKLGLKEIFTKLEKVGTSFLQARFLQAHLPG
jgi:hypothetical protein